MGLHIRMYADGGSRGNPGPAACGGVIYDLDEKGNLGELLADFKSFLGIQTNNFAEYHGIILGLKKALELKASHVDVFLDSQLAVKQLNGEYKVKHPNIAPLFLQVHNLRMQFERVTFTHIRRELNKEADALVNQVLDNQ